MTYRINYADADNDPPTYHGGVQGYVKLMFTGVSVPPHFLIPFVPTLSYITPAALTVTMTDAPEGTNKYHFEGSDGYDPQHWVRLPLAATTPPIDQNDSPITVNYKPVLSGAGVTPTAGLPSVVFTFTVTYRDTDGAQTTPAVTVRLIKIDDTPVELPLRSMTAGNGSIATGRTYTLAIPSGTLTAGTYSVIFEAYDGTQSAVPITLATNLQVRLHNGAPVIVDTAVNPAAGKTSTIFYYTAHYRDPDGDPPTALFNGQRYEALTLVIDKGASNERTLRMNKINVPGQNYTDAAGILFRNDGIVGTQLGSGSHTFEVRASDGTLSATPVSATGPILLLPTFDQLRVVSASAVDPFVAPALTSPAVGDNVLIVGRIKFPKNGVTGKPSSDQQITFTVTKPDATSFSLKGSMTMLDDSTDANYWVWQNRCGQLPGRG